MKASQSAIKELDEWIKAEPAEYKMAQKIFVRLLYERILNNKEFNIREKLRRLVNEETKNIFSQPQIDQLVTQGQYFALDGVPNYSYWMIYNNPDFESKDDRVKAFKKWRDKWTMKNGEYGPDLIL
ncbi:MAG TPA: hypothetical protein ENH13_03785 [Euryarchaeota archaeon]|nr:hypothetical protein BMS3Bbin16_00683 [archaeon BMS3Bbin16]HDH28234.1 hypothetical protein [Euryarchaeota archaeon]